MAQGVSTPQQRAPLYLLTNAMVGIAAHIPCQGRAVEPRETSLAWQVIFRFLSRVNTNLTSRSCSHLDCCHEAHPETVANEDGYGAVSPALGLPKVLNLLLSISLYSLLRSFYPLHCRLD